MSEIVWHRVDPGAPTLWRQSAWLFLGWLPILAGIMVGVATVWWVGLSVAALIALLLFVLIRTFSERRYLRLSYALADDGLLLRTGVLWRSERFVPRLRVQHVDVVEGPLARRHGLAVLSLHTAGAHLESADISGLRAADAYALRDTLLRRAEPAHDR
jgi:hypothetical protein